MPEDQDDIVQKGVKIVRNVLETHKIRSDKHETIEKCVGCTWIGWHHSEHVAETIMATLAVAIFEAINDELIPKDDA